MCLAHHTGADGSQVDSVRSGQRRLGLVARANSLESRVSTYLTLEYISTVHDPLQVDFHRLKTKSKHCRPIGFATHHVGRLGSALAKQVTDISALFLAADVSANSFYFIRRPLDNMIRFVKPSTFG